MKRLLLILLILFNFYKVNADEIDLGKYGSISITLKDENKYIDNVEIEIIKISDAFIDSNNLSFKYIDELSDCKLDLENITKCINNHNFNSLKKTTNKGVVTFNDLPLGIYYIRQINQVENYSTINTFLIALPQEIDNLWVYDIDATPKINIVSLTDITIKKIWNTDKKNKILDFVVVDLYQNDNKIKTVTLSKENNWEIVINDLPKSDSYKIKEINVPIGYIDSYSSNNYTYIVTNTPSLAQTGQLTYLYFFLLLIGLILVITGLIVKNEK